MEANKSQTLRNKRKRKRLVMKIEIPESDVVDITFEEENYSDKEKDEVEKKRTQKGKDTKQRIVKERAQRHLVSKSESKFEDDQNEGPCPKLDKELTKEVHEEILKTQKVLPGGIFDPEYADESGLRELVDDVKIQGWSHLFDWPVPALYEKEMQEFYVNMEITDDMNMNSCVDGWKFYLDEEWLGGLSKVSIKGIKSMARQQTLKCFSCRNWQSNKFEQDQCT